VGAVAPWGGKKCPYDSSVRAYELLSERFRITDWYVVCGIELSFYVII
jgi:hypothetical protein